MRKFAAYALALTLGVASAPSAAFAAVAPASKDGGSIKGKAQDAKGQALANYTVRVRNATTGAIEGSTTTAVGGSFGFTGLAGKFTVEIVDAAGKIVGLSPAVTVTAGATVSVTVTATALGAITAASAGGLSLFGLGPLATVGVFAGAAIITTTTIIATKGDASPSR